MPLARCLLVMIVTCFSAVATGVAEELAAKGWQPQSPRNELRPQFEYLPDGGRDGAGRWIVRHDDREGLAGWWGKSFAVQGGHHYKFQAYRRMANVATPRQSAVVRILWRD